MIEAVTINIAHVVLTLSNQKTRDFKEICFG